MKMETVCSMVDCYNSIDTLISCEFFPFPKDFDLCMQWVQNCGKPKLFEDFSYSGAQPFVNKIICSDHFHSSDFIDPNCINKGLKPEAIPVLKELDSLAVKEECNDDSVENKYLIKPEEELDCVKDETNELQTVDLNSFPSADDLKEEELEDEDSCLPLLIVLNDKDDNNSSSQKSKRAFHAAWNRALESEEEREIRNRTNALRNAFKRANETEKEKKARNLANACRNAYRRANESDDQRKDRLYKNAVRAGIRRSMESEFQQTERRRKNALRAAFRRSGETEEQRMQRRLKDKIRSAERRKKESELQSKIRKYNDAVRAAFRRNNESEEERQQRRMYDVIRAARRRSNESTEQRMKRLKTDRERAARRRLLKKIGVINSQDSGSEFEVYFDDLGLKYENDSKEWIEDKLKQIYSENDTNSTLNSSLNNQISLSDDNNADAINDNLNNSNITLNDQQHTEIVWCT